MVGEDKGADRAGHALRPTLGLIDINKLPSSLQFALGLINPGTEIESTLHLLRPRTQESSCESIPPPRSQAAEDGNWLRGLPSICFGRVFDLAVPMPLALNSLPPLISASAGGSKLTTLRIPTRFKYHTHFQHPAVDTDEEWTRAREMECGSAMDDRPGEQSSRRHDQAMRFLHLQDIQMRFRALHIENEPLSRTSRYNNHHNHLLYR